MISHFSSHLFSSHSSQFYLELSLEPRPAEAIKEVYLSGNTSPDDIDEVFDGFSRMAPECPLAAPSIYPQVQPLRAAFYIGEVQGFGKWRIVVSNNATKHLRELRRRDLAKTKHVLRKLRLVIAVQLNLVINYNPKGALQGRIFAQQSEEAERLIPRNTNL